MKLKFVIILLINLFFYLWVTLVYAQEVYPKIFLDEKIKYRIHYGPLEYQFIDIARSNCIYINTELICEFTDFSDIKSISLGRDSKNHPTPYIIIIKEKSIWHLFFFRDEPGLLKLVNTLK